MIHHDSILRFYFFHIPYKKSCLQCKGTFLNSRRWVQVETRAYIKIMTGEVLEVTVMVRKPCELGFLCWTATADSFFHHFCQLRYLNRAHYIDTVGEAQTLRCRNVWNELGKHNIHLLFLWDKECSNAEKRLCALLTKSKHYNHLIQDSKEKQILLVE